MAATDKNPSPYRKVEVQDRDTATLQLLREMGAERITPFSYGSSLWKVPAQHMSRLSVSPTVAFHDEYDLVGANGIYFYPQLGEPPIPDNLRQTKRDGYQMWLVKYDQPYNHNTTRKWLAAHDIKFIDGATTKTSFLVWVDEKQLAEVEAAVNPNGPILWAGPYHPYYRFDPAARPYIEQREYLSQKTVKAEVLFFKHPNVETSLTKLRALAIGPLLWNHGIIDDAPFIGHALELSVPELVTIANWPDTFLITLHYQTFQWDEVQNQVIAGNTTTTGDFNS